MNWTERRVLVTGATGIVGSWLVKCLLAAGAHIVALVRDWDPQTELIRSGDVHRTHVISGALEDYATLERAISEHEIQTVFHLGAQAIVTTALRSPLPTFEANIRGTYN
ncbi:MAG: GDP-mannose 4,6-dehydratase, partial [Thermoanaerobaculia bacterium]